MHNPADWQMDLEDGYFLEVATVGDVELRYYHQAPDENGTLNYGLELQDELETVCVVKRRGSMQEALGWFEQNLERVKMLSGLLFELQGL